MGSRKILTWKVPTHQTSPQKISPPQKISTQKIPTWNIPTHFINCLFSLNTSPINGGGVYMYILLPKQKFWYL